MARTQHSTEYYDYIDTCYECPHCGAKKYVKGEYTVVGWKTDTTSGYGSDGQFHSAEHRSHEKKIHISDDGYYHVTFNNNRGWCRDCLAKRRKKIIKTTSIVVAVILLISFVGTLFRLFLGNNSGFYEWTYKQSLKTFENHAEYKADTGTATPGKQVIDSIAKVTEEGDFYMHFYDEGSGEVQKYTLGDQVTYFYSFNDGCGELSNTTYIHADNILYVNGDEKIAYHSTAAEYSELLKKLQAYLPNNYCAKDTYTREGQLASERDDLYAVIAYGENRTALYDSSHGYYFEKTPELFIRIHFGEDDKMEKLPVLSDYKEVS